MPGLSITDLVKLRTARQYGADPNGNADSSSALTAMIHDIHADGGGIGFIDPGTYLASDVWLYSNVRLIGGGPALTTIKRPTGVTKPIFRSVTLTTNISPGTGESDIQIGDMTLDGQGSAQQNNTHTIWLVGTLRPRLSNLRLIGGTNFAASLQCCKSGVVEDIHAESTGTDLGLDGVHLWDSSEFLVRGIKGNTVDDLFAVTSDQYDVNSITVDGIVGQSSKSRVMNLECATTGRTLSSIRVRGLVAEASYAASVSVSPVSGSTIQDVDLEWTTYATSSRALYLTGAGTIQRSRLRGIIQGPQGAGVEMIRGDASNALDACEFEIQFNNVTDSTSMMVLTAANRCKVWAMGDYVNSGKSSPQKIIEIASGVENIIEGGILKGGSIGVQLGDTGVGVQTSIVRGNVFDGQSTNVVNETGTSTNNLIDGNVVVSAPTTPVVLAGGSTTKVTRNTAPVTENSGTKTITGDGATTTFTIAHGIVSTPNSYAVTPQEDPGSRWWASVDATNITIHYQTAPAAGTYHWVWRASYTAGG